MMMRRKLLDRCYCFEQILVGIVFFAALAVFALSLPSSANGATDVLNVGPIKSMRAPKNWKREDEKIDNIMVIRFKSMSEGKTGYYTSAKDFSSYDQSTINIWAPRSVRDPADMIGLKKVLLAMSKLTEPVDLSPEEMKRVTALLKHDDQTKIARTQFFPLNGRIALYTESESTYKWWHVLFVKGNYSPDNGLSVGKLTALGIAVLVC